MNPARPVQVRWEEGRQSIRRLLPADQAAALDRLRLRLEEEEMAATSTSRASCPAPVRPRGGVT